MNPHNTQTPTYNREGEDASKKFCEDDIDAILQQRATRIVHDAAKGKEGKVRVDPFSPFSLTVIGSRGWVYICGLGGAPQN